MGFRRVRGVKETVVTESGPVALTGPVDNRGEVRRKH